MARLLAQHFKAFSCDLLQRLGLLFSESKLLFRGLVRVKVPLNDFDARLTRPDRLLMDACSLGRIRVARFLTHLLVTFQRSLRRLVLFIYGA